MAVIQAALHQAEDNDQPGKSPSVAILSAIAIFRSVIREI
jgi:hypothetical protein